MALFNDQPHVVDIYKLMTGEATGGEVSYSWQLIQPGCPARINIGGGVITSIYDKSQLVMNGTVSFLTSDLNEEINTGWMLIATDSGRALVLKGAHITREATPNSITIPSFTYAEVEEWL